MSKYRIKETGKGFIVLCLTNVGGGYSCEQIGGTTLYIKGAQ